MGKCPLQQKNRGFEYTFKVFETTLKSGKWRADRESVEPWGMLGDGNARGGHRPPRQRPMLSHCRCEESVRIPLSQIKVGLKEQVTSEADQTYKNASEL